MSLLQRLSSDSF